MRTIRPSSSLANVRYEIRGDLARRAHEMERRGYEIIPLNIGNPGLFGFRTPETMRLAMIENLKSSEAYCHQKGVFPAREAVVMQQQSRGVRGVSADEVFMGNGVSELIDLVLRALLSTDDEVLVPSPDYPLWTAAVTLNHGRAVHYPCRPENGFEPDPRDIEALITSRTRAIVVINPNNPTGAVYSRATLEAIAQIAERHHLVVFSDEIYDQILYGDAEFVPMATLVNGTLCATLAGLSKVYRACGYRVGWAVFSGELEQCTRLSERAGQAVLAAPVQQRAGAVGGADRARRLPEHLRADAAGRPAVPVAPGDPRWRRRQQVSAGARAARCDLRVRRREGRRAAGLRRSAVRDGSARAQARAARAGHELQHVLQHAFPDHEPAAAGSDGRCVPPHGGAAGQLCGRRRAGLALPAPELRIVTK